MHACFWGHPLGAKNQVRSRAVGAINVLHTHNIDDTVAANCCKSLAEIFVVRYFAVSVWLINVLLGLTRSKSDEGLSAARISSRVPARNTLDQICMWFGIV